jgi:hypothetical protein
MRSRKSHRLAVAGIGLACAAMGLAARAQAQPAYPFVYDARFLCTANLPGTSQTTPSVLPGSYQSVIAVHNPSGKKADLRLSLAITFPAVALEPGPVSDKVLVALPADEAMQIDCETIVGGAFGIEPIHGAEGFVVVESTHGLAVSATHTAGSPDVTSLVAEQVQERVRQ